MHAPTISAASTVHVARTSQHPVAFIGVRRVSLSDTASTLGSRLSRRIATVTVLGVPGAISAMRAPLRLGEPAYFRGVLPPQPARLRRHELAPLAPLGIAVSRGTALELKQLKSMFLGGEEEAPSGGDSVIERLGGWTSQLWTVH